jgi:hypothetical protein
VILRSRQNRQAIAGIDSPGSEIDEYWEVDPDIWGTGGGRVYLYGGACGVVNAGMGADASAVTLRCGRVDIRTGRG